MPIFISLHSCFVVRLVEAEGPILIVPVVHVVGVIPVAFTEVFAAVMAVEVYLPFASGLVADRRYLPEGDTALTVGHGLDLHWFLRVDHSTTKQH